MREIENDEVVTEYEKETYGYGRRKIQEEVPNEETN